MKYCSINFQKVNLSKVSFILPQASPFLIRLYDYSTLILVTFKKQKSGVSFSKSLLYYAPCQGCRIACLKSG